jgi:hypothetical protein
VAGIRQIVDAPSQTLLPYGLLSVVEPLSVPDMHWQQGVTWRARCDDIHVTYTETIAVTGSGGAPPAPPALSSTFTPGYRGATPFTVYTEFQSSPVETEAANLITLAEDSLNINAQYGVEKAFWTGLAENSASVVWPHLAAAAQSVDAAGILLQTVPVTGGPFKPADALGFLEKTLADCTPTIGVIHIPRRALPAFTLYISASGGRLKTANGNLVAAGAGYPGTSPAGAAPAASQCWVYATSQIFEVHSSVTSIRDVPSTLDRSANTVSKIAERTYLLGWDCCHVGVLVDMSAV